MIISKPLSRLISLLMALVLLVGIFPTAVFAATETVEITSAKNDGSFENVTISVGDTLIIELTNGSTSNPKDYTTKVGNSTVAKVVDGASFELAASAKKEITIQGLADGTTTIVMEGTSDNGSSTYTATINLTVGTGGSGEEPDQTVENLTKVNSLTDGKYIIVSGGVALDLDKADTFTRNSGSSTYKYDGFNGKAVTVSGTKITGDVYKDMVWEIKAVSGGYTIKSAYATGTDVYLIGSYVNNYGLLELGASAATWTYSGNNLTTGGKSIANNDNEFDFFTMRSTGSDVSFYAVTDESGFKTPTHDGSTGDNDNQNPSTGKEVAITATSSGATAEATIAVGEKLTVKLTNGSSYNAKTFSGQSGNAAVATVESGSKEIAGGATGQFEVTGVANGTTTITFTGTGSGSAYTATITLTVGTGSSTGDNGGNSGTGDNGGNGGSTGGNNENNVVVIAGSDYQASNSSSIMTNIMNKIKGTYATVNGILMGGDYSASYTNASDIQAVDGVISGVYPNISSGNRIYVQGNHDEWGSLTPSNSLITATGAHDTDYYGVYSINYSDFGSAASGLQSYLNAKVQAGYTKPIFVLSHQPLHKSSRNDNNSAASLFSVMNAAGGNGLTIIFLFGHNHSNGTYDDYLGSGSIYLKKGDSIMVAGGSTETLNFTYMNYGYVGYIY